jgi:hypothetical protein
MCIAGRASSTLQQRRCIDVGNIGGNARSESRLVSVRGLGRSAPRRAGLTLVGLLGTRLRMSRVAAASRGSAAACAAASTDEPLHVGIRPRRDRRGRRHRRRCRCWHFGGPMVVMLLCDCWTSSVLARTPFVRRRGGESRTFSEKKSDKKERKFSLQ